MVSFRQLHSHLKLLSHDKLKGTRTESGFKRAFATLFGQDVETFIRTMFLNVDQLEKQLDKKEFQEIGSMASFKVLEKQFKMFIKSRMYLDDEFVVMTRNYFLQYTQLSIPEFRDTLIQYMESVKKSIDERALHKREYDTRVNERQIQITEDKVDSEQHGQFSKVKSNEAKVKHDINVIETINIELEHKVAKLLKENETLKKHYKEMYNSIKTTRARNIDYTTSLIAKNDDFKAQLQEKGFAIKQSVLTTTAFKSERPRISKQRFASQVDVNNDLSKPVTTHYLPKERESAVAKPHHMIEPGFIRWVPTGKIFTSSTTKVDSEPTNGSNDDITNQYECKQTLDVSAGTLNIHAGTSLNPTKEGLRVCSELGIHDHSNEQSSSKLVPKGSFSRQDSYIMTRVRITIPPSHNNAEKTYALSWNPGQGDLLNLPDTGYIKMEMVMPHSSEELEYGYLPSWAMRIIFGSDSWLLVLSYEMDGYRVVVGLVLAMRWRAANFEIKHGLLTLVQNKSSSGHDKEDHMPTSVTSIKSPPTLRYPNVPTTSISCCFFFSLYEGQPGYGLKKNPSDQFRTWMTSSAKVIIQFFSTFKRQNLRNEITNFKLRFGKFDGGGYVSDFEVGSDSKIFSEHVQFQGCSELSN
ncbi:hypothetical protein Tco_0151180 [Tanacetum coccineum]